MRTYTRLARLPTTLHCSGGSQSYDVIVQSNQSQVNNCFDVNSTINTGHVERENVNDLCQNGPVKGQRSVDLGM